MFEKNCLSLIVLILVGTFDLNLFAQDNTVIPCGAYVPFSRTFTVPQKTDTIITVEGSYERVNGVATNIDVTRCYANNFSVTIEGVYPFQNGWNITVDIYYKYLGSLYVYTINA